MELYRKVRLACSEGMSQREAARHFDISRDSVRKMLSFSSPPGYRREKAIKRPKLDGLTEIIDAWLEADKAVHRKQRHTAKRVFERLRDEHGFTGGYLPLIERKINALDQAAPLVERDLPEEFNTLRRLMEARMLKMGRREYVQILRLLESFDMDDLLAAVRQALKLGAVGFDAVKHLVLCQVEKRPPRLDLDVYPYMRSAADWPPLPSAPIENSSKVVDFCAAPWPGFTPPLTIQVGELLSRSSTVFIYASGVHAVDSR